MQLVLINNRIVAHGENFIAMGGVVINTETGAKFDNATIAECDGCPCDIDKVGYEYHAGTFVPCAPFGKADTGEIMVACNDCATPRRSNISIDALGELLEVAKYVYDHDKIRASFSGQKYLTSEYTRVLAFTASFDGALYVNVTWRTTRNKISEFRVVDEKTGETIATDTYQDGYISETNLTNVARQIPIDKIERNHTYSIEVRGDGHSVTYANFTGIVKV